MRIIIGISAFTLLCDVSDVVKDCGFGVFTGALENGGSVRGINVEGQAKMPRKKIDKLVEHAKGCGAKGLAYLCINEDGTYKSSFAKFMTEAELDALVAKMNGKPGDLLLFAADKNKIVWNVLGALRLMLGAELGLIDENKYNFLWVTEFPLLEWSDEENRFMAMHHPFTMPMEEDWDKIDSDPGAVRAKVQSSVEAQCVSIRMTSRRRCLRCLVSQRSVHMSSLDSCLMHSHMVYRHTQDLPSVLTVSACICYIQTISRRLLHSLR